MTKSFYFILNWVDFQVPLPYEIIPQHYFDKPTESELTVIQAELSKLQTLPIALPYEWQGINPMPSEGVIPISRLMPNEYKYWILRSPTEQYHLGLEYAFNVAASGLRLGYRFEVSSSFQSVSQIHIANAVYLSDTVATQFTPFIIDEVELGQIRSIYDNLCVLDSNLYPHIWRTIVEFDKLKFLPSYSYYKTLAYFTMLESLITFDPYSHPTAHQGQNGISKQLRIKFPILNNLFRQPIDLQAEFDTPILVEEILRRLYKYRSVIAHGDPIDFGATSDLALLKSQSHVFRVLTDVVKKAIIHALSDPTSITNLKQRTVTLDPS